MKSDANRIPKEFPANEIKEELKTKIGSMLEIRVMTNKRVSKTLNCKMEYVSAEIFGVRVFTAGTSYITSFSFADLFTGKIESPQIARPAFQ